MEKVDGSTLDTEREAIEQSICDAIGWALTKDFDLLFSVVAQDDGFFIFHPASTDTIVGFDAFKRFGEKAWNNPAFRATHFEIRELRIGMARCGTVAWYSCMLDDFGEWNGRETGWVNARWTGVLEKRGGHWVITQMHFSFPTDRPSQ